MYLVRERQQLRACSLAVFFSTRLSRTLLTNLQPSVGETQQAGLVVPMCWLRRGRSVFKDGSVRPLTAFLVRPDGVFNLVQAKKMELNDASYEQVESGSEFFRRMVDLRAWQAARQGVKPRAHVWMGAGTLNGYELHVAVVSHHWFLAQFDAASSSASHVFLGAGGAQRLGQNRVREKLVRAICHIGVERRQHAGSILEGV